MGVERYGIRLIEKESGKVYQTPQWESLFKSVSLTKEEAELFVKICSENVLLFLFSKEEQEIMNKVNVEIYKIVPNHMYELISECIRNVSYNTGYDTGYESGKSFGYDDGYDDGYCVGKETGYEDGR